MNSLCVFCGSSVGADSVFAEAARRVGTLLAERSIQLIYGGGKVGLMGIVADATLAAGGRVVGVIPDALATRELTHDGLTELHVVRSMHERKALMAERANGFLALPGGFGTLDELCEILTWSQLGLHRKPCGVLNVAGFYDPFVAQIQMAVERRFIRAEHAALLLVDTDPIALLKGMTTFVAPDLPKWINPSQS